MATILEALTSKNPVLDTRSVTPGPNTFVKDAVAPEGWKPWEDFTYEAMMSIFSRQLHTNYTGPSKLEAGSLPLDTTICNEDTFQVALHRFLMPVVNHCLHDASGTGYYGPGSRVSNSIIKPDWCCTTEEGRLYNYVPGDTKLSAKFQPFMYDLGEKYLTEWEKVIGQIAHYQSTSNSRYGFIITDQSLLVLRASLQKTAEHRHFEHPSRDVPVVNYSLDADASFANTTASYEDDTAKNWEAGMPEYAIISWEDHGPGKLTVRLALWCLAMIATSSDSRIDFSYPKLDSWSMVDDRYIHNVSGKAKSHADREDTIQTYNPETGAWDDIADAQPDCPGEVGAADVNSRDGGDDYDDGERDGGGTDLQGAVPASVIAPPPGEASQDDTPQATEDSLNRDIATIAEGLERVHVTIQRHRVSQAPYYTDKRGNKVDTKRSRWNTVNGKYELRGKRYLYVAESFPE